MRSADQIKEKYGRPSKSNTQSADDVAATMAQNRDKLLERGEKLSRLEEKMSQMTSDAAARSQLPAEGTRLKVYVGVVFCFRALPPPDPGRTSRRTRGNCASGARRGSSGDCFEVLTLQYRLHRGPVYSSG